MSKYNYTRKVINESGDVLLYPELSEFSKIIGTPNINVYADSANPIVPINTVLDRADGRYVYSKAGSSGLALATPLQSAAPAHGEQDDDIVVGAASAIGALTVTLTSTTNLDTSPNNVANDFAEGYLVVNDEAGEGQMYKIKSNEAFSTTDDSVFTLYEPLTIALTTASQVGLIRNPYYKTIVTAAPMTGVFVGVALFAVTATYYYWAKVKGIVPGKVSGSIAMNAPVVVGASAAKFSAITTDYATQIVVGHCVTLGVADTETCLIKLT